MTLVSTKRQEVSASRTHRIPLSLPCAMWPRWKRKPDRSASSRTQPSLSSGEDASPSLSLSRRGESAPAGGRDAQGAATRALRSRWLPAPPGPAHAAGRSEHDRARATRDLPGRAGCPGSRGAGSGAGPPAPAGREWGWWQPPSRPVPAAPYGGGAAAGASLTRQGGSMPPAPLCPPGPAAGSPPAPARPGPPRGADSGGGRNGGSRARRDVCSPGSIYSAAIGFHS